MYLTKESKYHWEVCHRRFHYLSPHSRIALRNHLRVIKKWVEDNLLKEDKKEKL